MSKSCAVKWCCALATHGEHCVVHAKMPDLHPVELEPGETAEMAKCDECKGTGACPACEGTREMECRCHCGDDHHAACDKCRGGKYDTPTGRCRACQGVGMVAAKPVKA